MIGIIGAMEEEVSVVLSETSDITVETVANIKFYKAKYDNKDLVIVQSGVGMVNAAIVTTILVEKFKVSKIIFSGVAGGLDENVKVGDIVIGNSFVEYTFDVTSDTNNYVLGQRAGTDKRDIDANKKMLDLTKDIDLAIGIDTHYGKIGSADIFVEDINEKKRLAKEFDMMAVDMESAAVAHACEVLDIPFLIIRSISDSITGNFMEFYEFTYLASNNSKKFLYQYLKRL